VLESRVRVEQQFVRLHAESGGDIGEANRVASAALRVFETHADDVGQCRAWSLRAWIEWNQGRVTRADEAWQRAAAHAEADGDERSLFEILTWRASAALYGPTPVRAAIETCTAILEQVRTNPVAVGVTTLPLAALHAMRGEFDHARALVGEANAILDDVGRMHSAAPLHEVLVETLAGNLARAENLMRPAYERLEQMGEKSLLATTAAHLARTLYALERYDEADQFCSASESAAAAEDVVSQVIWRGTRAKILARQGRVDEAEALVREAVRQVSQTDQLTDHSATLLDLAEVLRLAERPSAANAAVLEAIDLYTQKGNTVSAGHARSLLAMVATT
jgi:tetratricopeptide (TPR) repeat protein